MDCSDDIQEIIDEKVDNILMPHQKDAVDLLSNGRILYGGVGSGKSCTAMGYYMKKEFGKDVYIITTAKKRDSLDWLTEAARFGIGTSRDATVGGVLKVDSWNNIGAYRDVEGALFIFDEQRLVGNGAWVKQFLAITKSNRWILLSATPGDVWLDYGPVFIANGWYKNITEFKRAHVIYEPYRKYPVIKGYIGEDHLERLRTEILVEMPYLKHTERIVNYMDVGFDKDQIVHLQKTRWHPEEQRPFKDFAEMWRYIRKIVNSDPSRIEMLLKLWEAHPRLIIFYNFHYELDILEAAFPPALTSAWNGKRHDTLPVSDTWVYLVQYAAGSEGWNCTSTDAIAFYSLTYSYKHWAQSMGRIDRLDTPYKKLYYYVLKSTAWIDEKLVCTMDEKRNFNERNALKEWVSHEHLAVPEAHDELFAKYMPGV